MTRVVKTLLVLTVLVPALAEAQRPSNTMHTNSAQLYLDRGLAASNPEDKKRFFEQAMNSAMQGVQAQGNNSKSWFVLGKVYAALGDAAGADSAFDKAEAMWPDYAKETEQERYRAFAAASNAGVAAIQANDIPAAIAALEGAATVYNKRPTALLNLASIYSKQDDREKAIAAYRGALEILRGAERQGLKADEEKQWAEWEEASALNIAQLLAMAEKNEEAAKAYEEYLARNPGNALIRSNLALVYSRMGKREEAARVYRELLGQDLPADEFFRVGIGLRRAQQYDQAALAFQKAIAKNSQQQESYFNLAYVLWETIQPLEDGRAKATGADKTNMTNQLRPLYEQLLENAVKARQFDPTNRNLLALMQRAYRGLSELTTEVAKQNEYKLKIPPLIKEFDALPFEVTAITTDVQENKVTIEGKVVNIKTTRGQPMKFRLAVVDASGKELAAQDLSVTAPDVEAEADFKAEFNVTGYAGWKYSIIK
jgi:tetratricopeptide (TPR) repeat protein